MSGSHFWRRWLRSGPSIRVDRAAGPASLGRIAKLVGLAALFAAGLLLSGGLVAVGVADVTTTETLPTTTTTTVSETTTVPATTVATTVEQTTTRKVIVPPSGKTTGSASASTTTPTWVWVVLAVLASAVLGLLVALLTRRSGGVPAEERQQRLDAAVASWAAQGWALESQTAGSAILRHGSDLMVVSVDDEGHISTRPLAGS